MTSDRALGPSPSADRLLAATRRLMLAATTTALEDDEMLAVADRLDDLTAHLSSASHLRTRRIPYDADRAREMAAGAPYRMMPYNALGIPQNLMVHDGVARAELALTALHEGPPDMLHGGFAAAILDAALGVAVMAGATPAVTAELTVHFRRPTPLDADAVVEARIVEVGNRRIIAEGSITVNGVATVTAVGRFAPYAFPPGEPEVTPD